VVRKCGDYSANIEKYFGISPVEDENTIHPHFLCDRCHITLRNMDQGRANSTSLIPFEWSVHVDSHCTVSTTTPTCTCMKLNRIPHYICGHFSELKRPGRPRKIQKEEGDLYLE
jgi:hypothetical protein